MMLWPWIMPHKVNRWRVFELLLHDRGFSLNALYNYTAVLNTILSVNLVWHDLKLQRFSSTIEGVEKPLGLNVCPLGILLQEQITLFLNVMRESETCSK